MDQYRLYFIAEDHFTGVEVLDAGDDAEAIRQALERVHEAPAELWCGGRKVRLFEPLDGVAGRV